MTAVELTRLLKDRHVKDVFVPQCKMGAVGSRTLDGWALLPTWSPLTTIGYEIKVSRSDWVQDQKFEEYRTVCHLFFVVAPRGVVKAGELPDGVGLLEPIGQGTGCRLVMRTKATRGTPDDARLVRLMAHVLMWRKDTRDYDGQTREQRAAFWRSWVEEKKHFHAIGYSVSERMRTMLSGALDDKRAAEVRAQQLEDTARAMTELGLVPGYDYWSTKRRIEKVLQEGSTETLVILDDAMRHLSELRTRLVPHGTQPSFAAMATKADGRQID